VGRNEKGEVVEYCPQHDGVIFADAKIYTPAVSVPRTNGVSQDPEFFFGRKKCAYPTCETTFPCDRAGSLCKIHLAVYGDWVRQNRFMAPTRWATWHARTYDARFAEMAAAKKKANQLRSCFQASDVVPLHLLAPIYEPPDAAIIESLEPIDTGMGLHRAHHCAATENNKL